MDTDRIAEIVAMQGAKLNTVLNPSMVLEMQTGMIHTLANFFESLQRCTCGAGMVERPCRDDCALNFDRNEFVRIAKRQR